MARDEDAGHLFFIIELFNQGPGWAFWHGRLGDHHLLGFPEKGIDRLGFLGLIGVAIAQGVFQQRVILVGRGKVLGAVYACKAIKPAAQGQALQHFLIDRAQAQAPHHIKEALERPIGFALFEDFLNRPLPYPFQGREPKADVAALVNREVGSRFVDAGPEHHQPHAFAFL